MQPHEPLERHAGHRPDAVRSRPRAAPAAGGPRTPAARNGATVMRAAGGGEGAERNRRAPGRRSATPPAPAPPRRPPYARNGSPTSVPRPPMHEAPVRRQLVGPGAEVSPGARARGRRASVSQRPSAVARTYSSGPSPPSSASRPWRSLPHRDPAARPLELEPGHAVGARAQRRVRPVAPGGRGGPDADRLALLDARPTARAWCGRSAGAAPRRVAPLEQDVVAVVLAAFLGEQGVDRRRDHRQVAEVADPAGGAQGDLGGAEPRGQRERRR